ncbi:MAG: translation initiation factor IF-2 [Caldilineaceae bacterium]
MATTSTTPAPGQGKPANQSQNRPNQGGPNGPRPQGENRPRNPSTQSSSGGGNENRQSGRDDNRRDDNRREGNRPDYNRPGGNRPDGNRSEGGNRGDNNRPDNRRDNNRPGGNRPDGNRSEGGRRDNNQPSQDRDNRPRPQSDGGNRSPDRDNRPRPYGEGGRPSGPSNRSDGPGGNRGYGSGGNRTEGQGGGNRSGGGYAGGPRPAGGNRPGDSRPGQRDSRPGGSRPGGAPGVASRDGKPGSRPANRDNRVRDSRNDRTRRESREEIEEREAKLLRETKAAAKAAKVPPTEVAVGEFITVRDLASLMERSPIDLIKILMQYGIMAPITHNIDHDTAVILGEELGVKVKFPKSEAEEAAAAEIVPAAPKTVQGRIKDIISGEDSTTLVERSPVVAVLGHVDHGKTTLLDRIRHTDVASGEAGGITQRTGAYQVNVQGKKITFLDTPGHEAFTAMRARGAQVTDIVVLVVAADDGVMPQTREAISHAKAAGVQIMVAVNKIDKPNANPERVYEELSKEGLQPEQWGGETITVPVSALRNEGVDDLLDNILVLAELNDYKANPKGKLVGTIVEASLDKLRGVTATLLVQNGTLRIGDSLVVGNTWGRVKALFDYEGKPIKQAGPSTPVIVLGLQEAPMAGELFELAANEREAKAIVEERRLASAESQDQQRPRMSLEEIFARFEGGETKTLNLIVRADLQGTLEPVVKSLEELKESEIGIKILQAAVGNISESDVMLAEASDAVIIGFSVGIDKAAASRAEQSGIEIRQYDIIYKMIEDIQDALKGMLEPVYENVPVAHATVLQLFKIRKGVIAGCMVNDGLIKRGALARVLRNGTEVLNNVRIDTLRRFTEDVTEVRSGFECGIKLSDKDEVLEIGDTIEVLERQRKR